MDPEKRSLPAMKEAIIKAVSFTIDDESLDDFCTEERDVVRASANREPLRTPSIQSPQFGPNDAFPWAKALQASPPHKVRQLSAIPDDESYEEELFPASEKGTESWFSVHANTPSLASVMESNFANSYKSHVHNARQFELKFPPRSDPVPITGSLPSRAAKPLPSMSMIFGKKDTVSKSWSDLWEEEESENEALRQRRENNGRSYSRDSDDGVTVRPDVLSPKTQSSTNIPSQASAAAVPTKVSPTASNENDAPAGRSPRSKQSPGKSVSADMWADLGNRRRNHSVTKEKETSATPSKKRSMTISRRKDWGLGSSGFDYGAWTRRGSRGDHHRERPAKLDQDWRRDQNAQSAIKSSGLDGSSDEDEWVGGWHAFHL